MSIEAMKQALEALLDSIDDVRDCLNQNLPHAGYARYDRRIEAYREQISKHEKAIVDLIHAIDAVEKQEPVAWMYKDKYGNLHESSSPTVPPDSFPVYTKEEIQRLSALVRAQQITIEKLEAQPPAAPVQEEDLYDLAVKADNGGQP